MVIGFNSCGGDVSAIYGQFLRNAALQVGMQNMIGGIFGGGSGVYATQPYGQQAPVQQTQQQAAPKITKEQVELAYDNYNNLVQLCTKAEAYKNDTETTLETLTAKKATAEKGVLAIDQELATLNGKLMELRASKAPDAQIKAVEDQIKAKEKEKTEAQKNVERAKLEIDAYNLAQKGQEEALAKVVEQKETAYKEFQAISQQYAQQTAQERQAQEAIENQKEDKDAAGSWWGRSKWNPENWTNMNYKGEKDNSANVAKCLRILAGKGGRTEALAYAEKHNLVTKDENGNYQTDYPELKKMIALD